MSSLVQNKPEIQKRYEETYRNMRNEHLLRVLDELVIESERRPHLAKSVLNAYRSWRQSYMEFDGWINPYRKCQFQGLKRHDCDDVPF